MLKQILFQLTLILVAMMMPAMCHAGDFRPPAVPLVTHNPALSIWSKADHLYDETTWHYSNRDHPLVSLIRVDGKTFRLMGAEPADLPPLPQKSLRTTPTRTIYEFEGEGIHVTLCFMQPLLPDDLDVLSWPMTYLTWSARSTDGTSHQVQLYDSTSAQLSVTWPSFAVGWERLKSGGLTLLRVGPTQQPAGRAGADAQHFNWQRAYAATREAESTAAIGENKVLEQSFVASGGLPLADDTRNPRAADKEQPVLAFAFELGKVGAETVQRQLLVGFDERYPIQFFGKNLPGYWARNGMTMEEVLAEAAKDYPQLLKRCESFDKELTADLTEVGGAQYAQIAALAYRQTIAACGLVADTNGQPFFFTKEITSNDSIATVDVLFPMSPIWILLSPALAKASVAPILVYSASERWRWPNAPHDLGTYPIAASHQFRDDGGYDGAGMPVEENGNILLLCDAIAKADGNADFVAPWWPLLTKWAQYLEQYGLDPENQPCTDDFMGPSPHNANLSVKAILGLAAYGDLCRMRGDAANAKKYTDLAKSDAQHWMKVADDGDHYRLAFDKPGTWSQKYNLVWDRILGLNVFPPEVARKEVAFYKTKLEKCGLPLDSRTDLADLDHSFLAASMAENRPDFEAIVAVYYHYINSAKERVPLTDCYHINEVKGKPSHLFHARPVVGGVFMRMLADGAVWKKWASRDQLHPSGWAPAPPPPKITTLVPLEQEWRYTTTTPAEDWNRPDFDDSSWSKGQAGFGVEPPPHALFVRHTEWNTKDIWMRREITVPEGDHPNLKFLAYHHDGVEIYVNGIRAAAQGSYVTSAVPMEIPIPSAQALLKPGAKVLLSVHCNHYWGPQGVDVGLADVTE
ncbi:MAG: DUF4965 domain-containing protein [Verrucomicrobiota bacterium]